MAGGREQLIFVLGTLLVVRTALCYAEKHTAQCDTGTHFATVSPVVPAVLLQCTQPSQARIASGDSQLYEYTEGGCSASGQTPEKLLAKLNVTGTWTQNELTITKFPSKNEKLCLLCKDSEVTCKVVVDIAKDAESCSRSGAAAVNLNLTLREKETVYFKCPATDDLSPAAPGQAYKEDCGELIEQLPEELVRNDNSTAKTYSLTLAKAPLTPKTFCYACSKSSKGSREVEKCFIKVTTQTTTQPGTQPPSGPSTESGTVIAGVSMTAGWAIALATCRHL